MGKGLRKHVKISLGHFMNEEHHIHTGEKFRWREPWASCTDLEIINVLTLSLTQGWEGIRENLEVPWILPYHSPPLSSHTYYHSFLVMTFLEDLMNWLISSSAQIPAFAQPLSLDKLSIMCWPFHVRKARIRQKILHPWCTRLGYRGEEVIAHSTWNGGGTKNLTEKQKNIL